MAGHHPERYAFAEPMMLEKIDKLFACGIGDLVDLPQIVVVGDQSSGKSSVLEGLIKKPFPRDSGLCTRFTTHIVFRRAIQEQILVSIMPDRYASPEHSSRLKEWGRAVPDLDPNTFRQIMEEAHLEMGLSGNGDETERKPTFSSDVLRLEISGPDQEHLSIIDVPGIFKSTTKGLTTKADIGLVRNMVTGYMKNPRSIMLAVVPANVDVATQEILELAAEFDVHGDRTLGVLTKPDLVDTGAESGVAALSEGKARRMKLGWHISRNPGQKELQDNIDRNVLEADFFRSCVPWSSVDKDKVGVDSLRLRLKEVHSSLVKTEFPRVKIEIKSRLDACRERLAELGPERNNPAEQMAYLTRISTRFQRLVVLALNATHGADDVFETDHRLRIAPAIMSRMKTFSEEMAKYGHTYAFTAQDNDAAGDSEIEQPAKLFEIRKEDYLDELVNILHLQGSLQYPKRGYIRDWILQIFQNNRGFELGTFNASLLATCMKRQSSKWTDVGMGFVSDVIIMVHNYVETALASICNDPTVCNSLMDKLSDELIKRYQRAITNIQFLLDVEKSDTPLTLNHYFNENLQKSRQGHFTINIEKHAFHNGSHGRVVRLEHATQTTRSMSNEDYVMQDIHDILQSYYKVSRKTFVDSVCKQAVLHHLLQCEESPLALFSPIFVSQLSMTELEELAGEAPALKRSRSQLTKEMTSLLAAMKILARA
ncbi:hypothetical protein B0A48_18618 [Cryoendolithus antarcticus]|uniref:GED domain-containing protein n=1 Tax=Cryoendolithus antarcticus TaxID=1507870 RepID=A0A1V8S8K4_9PEZI|nr:hypothetical protein B0A48_18618 [Cryoendolithus antarcticus]